MRVFSAVTVAFVLCAAPAFADAQSHVQAAKKAEKKGDWKKALEAWKAAYNADINAEYLIGIGDAYAKLGNNGEARKNYEAYLADPLALPANVERVKTKIASLDNAGGGLALPGAATALALPGSQPAPPPLDLGAAPSSDKGKKGGKKGKDAAPPPPLPGLDLPGEPTAVAANDKKADPMLALPGLDLPAATPSPAKNDKKVATAAAAGAGAAALELPPLPGATPPPAKPDATKKDQTAVASNQVKKTSTTGQQVAMTQPKPPEHTKVPEAAIAAAAPQKGAQAEASGTSKTVGYIAAGVAVVAFGGGAFAYSKASSAHSDLTGSIHDGATAQSLLETEQSNKTLSFVGFAAGLVSAGIAVALFAF